jgi:hypothetical protein
MKQLCGRSSQVAKPKVTKDFRRIRHQILTVERERDFRLTPGRFYSTEHLEDANEFADKLHVHLI